MGVKIVDDRPGSLAPLPQYQHRDAPHQVRLENCSRTIALAQGTRMAVSAEVRIRIPREYKSASFEKKLADASISPTKAVLWTARCSSLTGAQSSGRIKPLDRVHDQVQKKRRPELEQVLLRNIRD